MLWGVMFYGLLPDTLMRLSDLFPTFYQKRNFLL